MTGTYRGREDEAKEKRAAKASAAAEALKRGEVVLLYDFDDRERETDLVIGAGFVTPEHIWQLRRDAGGLVCVAIDPVACSNLGLPYIADVLKFAAGSAKGDENGNGRGNDAEGGEDFGAIESLCERQGDIPYDTKSSFSLWVNHRETFTGITDFDRALTIKRLAEVTRQAMNGGSVNFGAEFRSPGRARTSRREEGADGAVHRPRQGREGRPAVVVCEMLDGETGRALSKEEAMRYAELRSLAFVEGEDVLGLFEEMRD